jgi:hypothetical protein
MTFSILCAVDAVAGLFWAKHGMMLIQIRKKEKVIFIAMSVLMEVTS